MLTSLTKLSRLSLLCLAAFVVVPSYAANVTSEAKATVKKKPSKRKAVAPTVVEEAPEIKDAKSTDFECDAGNKITLYTHANDESRVAMRWKNKLTQMTRIDTTTGADRFENTKAGLVWIGIPAKGMLLDAKKGQQLANECKSAEQRAIPVETTPTAAAEPVKG